VTHEKSIQKAVSRGQIRQTILLQRLPVCGQNEATDHKGGEKKAEKVSEGW